MARKKQHRPDKEGTHRYSFERNRKIIYATQEYCGICGMPVDLSLKPPNPLSPTLDHIIPISLGGHPSDLANLQLAHMICNQKKGQRLVGQAKPRKEESPLTVSADWANF